MGNVLSRKDDIEMKTTNAAHREASPHRRSCVLCDWYFRHHQYKAGMVPLGAYIQALVHLGLHYRQHRPECAFGETVIQELLYEQHTQSIVLDVDVKHNLRSLADKSYHIMPSVP